MCLEYSILLCDGVKTPSPAVINLEDQPGRIRTSGGIVGAGATSQS